MTFDIVVIGGGHAGCEAAAVAARMGARVALVTMTSATIGVMSCNPAIGGIGKGHLVREIDVFDGVMSRAADAAAIHHRMLNASKGAAVRGPRIQADRQHYRMAVQQLLAATRGLTIVEAQVDGIIMAGGRIIGVTLGDGTTIAASAVIVASGTFLRGKMHFGLSDRAGGRIGEQPAVALADQLRAEGLPLGRLKTGTPPRLDGRSIDWARVERQPSDGGDWTMSAATAGRMLPQLSCGITRTNAATHDVVRSALARSPLYAGVIEGQGPRYCPSIEDKVVKFGDRDGHQIFLEPEGLNDPLIYPNGISTSLPLADQQRLIATIFGLEQARIVTPGYAVEYDHVDPRILSHRLEVRDMPGLFCAGQINGTTGYEEAAAQGLVAGMNAAASVLGLELTTMFDRTNSYIGVMIDDLVLQGITEPYRMLTSRAEHRLRLRADNAHHRLAALALQSNAVGERGRALIDARARVRSDLIAGIDAGGSGGDRLRREIAAELDADVLYRPYLERAAADADRLARDEAVRVDIIADYRAIPGLSHEMIERLDRARPVTLGQAGRIRGITPAALAAIMVAAHRAAA